MAYIWKNSQKRKEFSSTSKLIENNQYILVDSVYSYIKDDGPLTQAGTLDTTGMTQLTIIGDCYFNVFEDDQTQELAYDDITQTAYDNLALEGAQPPTKA